MPTHAHIQTSEMSSKIRVASLFEEFHNKFGGLKLKLCNIIIIFIYYYYFFLDPFEYVAAKKCFVYLSIPKSGRHLCQSESKRALSGELRECVYSHMMSYFLYVPAAAERN